MNTFRTALAGAMIAGALALVQAQSASAPLLVTATVVSTCTVAVPRRVDPSVLLAVPVAVTCARRGAAAQIQRPPAPRRGEARDAVLLINF